jgi:hypothetical protein
MRKILLLAVVLSLTWCGMVQASIFDTMIDYVKARPAKVGVSYDFDDSEILATVGTAVLENAFSVENLDIDLLVSGGGTEMFDNDNKIITLGPSYNIKLSDNSKIALGASVGVECFENFQEEGNLGEGKALVSLLYKHNF